MELNNKLAKKDVKFNQNLNSFKPINKIVKNKNIFSVLFSNKSFNINKLSFKNIIISRKNIPLIFIGLTEHGKIQSKALINNISSKKHRYLKKLIKLAREYKIIPFTNEILV